ncbi:MAG: hypothetical protein H8E21_10155 [Gammaproteobacteria bacterium]|nr:hypothetical protein [Gammaproteobacteria bacterium]
MMTITIVWPRLMAQCKSPDSPAARTFVMTSSNNTTTHSTIGNSIVVIAKPINP